MKFGVSSIFCVISGVLPLSIVIFASFLTDFVIFSDYISKVGTGNLAILFNSSLVLSAILLVPFILELYKHYRYIVVLFLAAAASLALVGLFPMASPLHNVIAGAFFVLAFTSVLFAGLKMNGWKKKFSVSLAILCAIGLIFFNPFIETLQVFSVGIWVVVVGLLSAKNNLY